MKKVLSIILISILLLVFASCDFQTPTSDQKEYLTDSDGNTYYIVNENHFTFDDYNVLEVVVSDSEKIILYDTKNDDRESGIGEWIIDGISYPISFMDYEREHSGGKHANIVISPDAYYGNYWQTSDTKDNPPLIAMINNDTENPGLYRWSHGTQLYNVKFEDEKTPVQYVTYTRNDLDDRYYIPQKAAKFYSADTDNISFVSEELSLSFNGKTGEGIWQLNGIDIPVIASFDKDQFILYVRYNTTDEREGNLIFEAKGTSVNNMTDREAIFTLTDFPKNCNYETITTITIKKIAE